MESDIVDERTLWEIFHKEYFYSDYKPSNKDIEWWKTWEKFIESKDLGISIINTGIYKIIDRKKWFLNKIKYGI